MGGDIIVCPGFHSSGERLSRRLYFLTEALPKFEYSEDGCHTSFLRVFTVIYRRFAQCVAWERRGQQHTDQVMYLSRADE